MKLAGIFQKDMVLQRKRPVPVWGSAAPGADIRIDIQGKQACARADAEGRWSVMLPPLEVSEAETLTVASGQERISLEYVAVGDVFLAAGQSNMEFWMRYEKHVSEERANCLNPMIRYYDVPEIAYAGQENDFDYSACGLWRQAAPDTLDHFSAAGWYFAREMYEALHVPVGMIGCSFGGTSISSWVSRETLQEHGKFYLDEYEAWARGTDLQAYWEKQHVSPMNDRGRPFAQPFNEFILPRTPSMEEIGRFFENMPKENGDMAGLRKPESMPCSLYEHMIKSVAPFGIRGVLWYQGESDDEKDHQELYAGLLKGLMADWRGLWEEELPFFIVQLPGWKSWLGFAGKNWMRIREAQEQVCREDAHAFLISISDAGEELDIHPKDKKRVGKRLAWSVLSHLYGKDLLCDAPVPAGVQRTEGGIRIMFANAGEGLYVDGDSIHALEWLEGGESVPFHAQVRGNTVTLTAKRRAEGPARICLARCMWYQVNLFGSSGIPAVPFEITVE